MKKSLAEKIAKLWNENFAGCTGATKTKATAKFTVHGDYDVVILPDADNTGGSFYHTGEIADVMRAFKVSSIITTEQHDGHTVVVGYLF